MTSCCEPFCGPVEPEFFSASQRQTDGGIAPEKLIGIHIDALWHSCGPLLERKSGKSATTSQTKLIPRQTVVDVDYPSWARQPAAIDISPSSRLAGESVRRESHIDSPHSFMRVERLATSEALTKR